MSANSPHYTTGSTRRPPHQWTFEQRLCLDVLATSQTTQLSGVDRALVFNTIFKAQVTAHGNPDGLSASVIAAQYNERKKTQNSCWRSWWERICAVPKGDLALRRELQAKIDDVLQNGNANNVQSQAGVVTTPPVTPRRTDRARTETQNPYDLITFEPRTPVRKQNYHEYAQAYPTPGPSHKKRPAELMSRQCADGENSTDDEYTTRVKKARRSSPVVVVPPLPSQLITNQPPQGLVKTSKALTKTPKRRPGEPREGATMRLVKPSGKELMLRPHEYNEAIQPLEDVTEEAAHPHPPAMLFRFWHNKSHGINSSNGFVSGKFVPQRILVEPRGPPDCNTLDMNDVANHLNNHSGTDQDGIPSPFVSTANNLSWATRMALKRMDLDAKLSVMDTSKLDAKSIYYVPPFYASLKKQRCLERGYFGYKGTHEHLLWHKVPDSAMVKTFSIQDLIRFTNSDRDVKRVLRLDVMAVAKTPAIEIMKALKHSNLEVNSRVAAAVGKIVLFLGLDHKSTREMLSRAVFEVLQGWALKADGKSQDRANFFVKQFQDKSAEYVDINDQIKLKHAFLHGMLWSCGDLNVHLKGRAGHDTMQARARKRGLADPEMLLINELNEAMGEIAMFEREQLELHSVVPRQRPQIQGEQADEDEDEDEDVVPAQLGRLNLEEGILYE